MRILEKHPISVFGSYLVVEGSVDLPECGNARFCWVEDENGNMLSELVDRDLALGIAETMAADSGTSIDDVEDEDEPPPRWLH